MSALKRPSPKTKAAQELIASSTFEELPKLPDEAVSFLKDMLAYNDASGSNRGRQSAAKVRRKLQEAFGIAVGERRFGRLIEHHFGRRWGSQ